MTIKNLTKLLRTMIVGNFIISLVTKITFWFLAANNSCFILKKLKSSLNGEFWGISVMHEQKLLQINQINLSNKAALIGSLSSLIYCIIIGTYMIAGLKLCKLYGQNSFFTLMHAKLYKQISIVFMIYGSIGLILMQACQGLALTFDNGPGQRLLNIGIGTPNMEMIFLALIIYLISQIMYQGAEIQAEQNLTI